MTSCDSSRNNEQPVRENVISITVEVRSKTDPAEKTVVSIIAFIFGRVLQPLSYYT